VTIKTPKYVIQQAKEPPSFVKKHWLMFSLIGLAFLTFLIGRYSNLDVLNAFKGQKVTWDEVNQQLTAQNEAQLKSISLLETELKVKDQAIKELQQSLTKLSQEKASIKADLAFYENLLSHKDGIKTLRVFDLQADVVEDWVNLKVVLAQKLEKAQVISGTLGLELTGVKQNKGEVINLIEQFKLDDDFEFKYFQIKKYTFSLPKGFNPTTLLVELKSTTNRKKVITEQFQWSEIVNNSPKNLAEDSTINAN